MSQLFEKQPCWVTDSLRRTLSTTRGRKPPVGDGVGKMVQVLSGDHDMRILRVTDGETTVTST